MYARALIEEACPALRRLLSIVPRCVSLSFCPSVSVSLGPETCPTSSVYFQPSFFRPEACPALRHLLRARVFQFIICLSVPLHWLVCGDYACHLYRSREVTHRVRNFRPGRSLVQPQIFIQSSTLVLLLRCLDMQSMRLPRANLARGAFVATASQPIRVAVVPLDGKCAMSRPCKRCAAGLHLCRKRLHGKSSGFRREVPEDLGARASAAKAELKTLCQEIKVLERAR